ncbi:MAG: hypothetical protein SFY66_17365 [Oculatellaceae cyanobacterium bins.114]|nr:hypothetical protein [Oculatellaceae cyanobacterium bins.114]
MHESHLSQLKLSQLRALIGFHISLGRLKPTLGDATTFGITEAALPLSLSQHLPPQYPQRSPLLGFKNWKLQGGRSPRACPNCI